MNIYVDEAGVFIPPRARRRYSLVLALVVPTAAEAELFYQFLRLRDSWPEQAVEIKGSKLSEKETAQVMNLLARHEVIAEYCGIDMALHPDDVIDEFKDRQAAGITENLTPAHAEAVVRKWHEVADGVRRLANPLFVQAFLTIDLIIELLHTAVNYFVQRRPTELGRFAWTIDRKDRTITEMEQLWSTLILPIGEARSAQRPVAKVQGFDYSHFTKYLVEESTADEKMKLHLQWMRDALPSSKPLPQNLRCIDGKRIWTEERAFADSQNNLGLQLADIAATTLCRALNGNLQQPGWEPIAQILIRKFTAPFFQFGKAAGQHPGLEAHAANVWRTLSAQSQPMVLERSKENMADAGAPAPRHEEDR